MRLVGVPAMGVLPGRELGVAFAFSLGGPVVDERETCEALGGQWCGCRSQVRGVIMVVRVVVVNVEIDPIRNAILLFVLL
eukprot:13794883-Heterocapsa_arctica.AAC.1